MDDQRSGGSDPLAGRPRSHQLRLRILFVATLTVVTGSLAAYLMLAPTDSARPQSSPDPGHAIFGHLATPAFRRELAELVRRRPAEDAATVRFRVLGLRPDAMVNVSCWRLEPTTSRLWISEVSSGSVMEKELPPAVSCRLVVENSPDAPRQARDIEADRGEIVEAVFDYTHLPTTVFQLTNMPAAAVANRGISISYTDAPVTTGVQRFCNARTDGQGRFHVTVPQDNVLTLIMSVNDNSCELVDAETGRGSFTMSERVQRVAPDQELVFVKALHQGLPVSEFLGSTSSVSLLYPSAGVLTIPAAKLGDWLTVFSLHGWKRIPRSELQPGQVNWVDLGGAHPGLRLTVETSGPVREDLELVLHGPEVEGLPHTGWSKDDPRVQARRFQGDRVVFAPLIPGHFSLRWRSGTEKSPVIRQVAIGPEPDQRITIPAPHPEPCSVTIVGWRELLDRVGAKNPSIWLAGRLVAVSAEGSFSMLAWNREPIGRLTIGHEAFLFHEPVVAEESRSGGSLRLAVSPDTAVVRVRAAPVAGGTLGLQVPRSLNSLGARPDGEFRLVAGIGQQLEAELWEGTPSGRIFRGRLSLVPQSRETVVELDAPGRWVDIDVRGPRQTLDVCLPDLPVSRPWNLGTLLAGSPFRVWIPNDVRELVLRRGAAVKRRLQLTAGTTVLSVDLDG